MDRIASLADRAGNLRRALYASLPPGEKRAAMLLFATDLEEAIGRQLGAEFLKAGVTDMPEPGPRWNPAASQPALTLPANYLKAQGSELVRFLRGKFRDMDVVTDGAIGYLTKIQAGKIVINPVPLRTALSYVRDKMVKLCLDVQKHNNIQNRHEESMHSIDDEGTDTTREFADEGALGVMLQDLGPNARRKMIPYLERISPWAPNLVLLLSQGETIKEMVEEGTLKNEAGEPYPFSPQAVMKPGGLLDKVREAVSKFYKYVLKEPMPGSALPVSPNGR